MSMWLGKGSGSGYEWVCYLPYAEKRIAYHSLYDNLCCKIASDDRIPVFLVVCGVERHMLSLN